MVTFKSCFMHYPQIPNFFANSKKQQFFEKLDGPAEPWGCMILKLCIIPNVNDWWSLWPGTLAACCKPSSGAGVVSMDTLLNGPGLKPGHRNGTHFKESYRSTAIPGRRISDQPEKRKTEEPLAATLECKVVSSSPNGDKDFSGHFSSLIAIVSAYSVLVE